MRKRRDFGTKYFIWFNCIPQNEVVVFAGDMNGHIASSNVGYDGTHGGFGYSCRNADGSRILEFADGLNLFICNTLFTKQEAKLLTICGWPGEKYNNNNNNNHLTASFPGQPG